MFMNITPILSLIYNYINSWTQGQTHSTFISPVNAERQCILCSQKLHNCY